MLVHSPKSVNILGLPRNRYIVLRFIIKCFLRTIKCVEFTIRSSVAGVPTYAGCPDFQELRDLSRVTAALDAKSSAFLLCLNSVSAMLFVNLLQVKLGKRIILKTEPIYVEKFL